MLDAYWQVLPGVRRELFAPADRPGYSRTQVEAAQVKATIFGHCEVGAFNARVTELFGQWEAGATALLTGMQKGQRPGADRSALREPAGNVQAGRSHGLADRSVGVCQHLMDYWDETLHDDAWMISSDRWRAVQDGKPNEDLIPGIGRGALRAPEEDGVRLVAGWGPAKRRSPAVDLRLRSALY